jgi:integrase
MEFKGITVGTYISRKAKNRNDKNVCTNCEVNMKILKSKHIDKEKEYELCKGCEKCYVSKSCKALLTIGRDQTTGKTNRKTFVAETEEQALADALQYKLDLDKNGGPRIITKSNKTLVELLNPCLNEQFALKKIDKSTLKRKQDTLKQIAKFAFANKPIAKVTREDVVNYLSNLSKYSESTIKQNYELLCMGFGEAEYQKIIQENFMTGYKRVLKPKSEYVSHKRKSLTIQEEKKLVDYLMNVSYEECSYKYLLLWQLTTGMRIGETLVLDYKKDILLSENKVEIRKTQTKDENGKIIIGETTKTENGRRTLTMNNISKQIIEKALEHKIKNKDNLLFCKPDGTMHLENSINSCLKRIALKLNIGIYEDYDKKGKLVKKTDIHTHMLRGTFATRCAEAKIAPVVLKQILGHKDISVTMKYYVDVDGSFIESETDNAIQYLVDKNIFGVELPDTNVA